MEHQCTRREFFIGAAKVVATAGAASVLLSAKKKAEKLSIDITKEENKPLATIGGAVLIANPSKRKGKILIYRKSEKEVLAFDATCTHKGGPLLEPKNGELVCKWHKAKFSLEGNVVKGPAKKDLAQYPTMIEGSLITVSLV